jgi:hypothetical protein
MNRKNESWWILGLLLASILIVGIGTAFRYDLIRLHRDNISFHFGPVKSIIYLTAFLYTLKNLYLIATIVLEQARIFAMLVSVIIPIKLLFFVYLIYSASIVHPHEAVDIVHNQVFLLGALILCLSIIEIKILLEMRRLLMEKKT